MPGPASYGNGGPLAVTDINLLSGRVDPETFGIPLEIKQASDKLDDILHELGYESNQQNLDNLLVGFLTIANQKMADAVKKISIDKGFDPIHYYFNFSNSARRTLSLDIISASGSASSTFE